VAKTRNFLAMEGYSGLVSRGTLENITLEMGRGIQVLILLNLLLIHCCHPERSRFSGVAKDLPLNRPIAPAKLSHYPTPRPTKTA